MEWEDLSEYTRVTMEELGDFGPTVNVKNCEIKGYMQDGKVYWNSVDLRAIANSCIEVADWLDNRAKL